MQNCFSEGGNSGVILSAAKNPPFRKLRVKNKKLIIKSRTQICMVYITPVRNVGARNVGTQNVGARIFILLPRFFNCRVYITSVPGRIPGFYIKTQRISKLPGLHNTGDGWGVPGG